MVNAFLGVDWIDRNTFGGFPFFGLLFWFYVDDPEAYHHQIKLMLLHAFGIVVDQSN